MDTPAVQVGMPLEECIRLYDTEEPFELVNDERIPKTPNVAGHGVVVKILFLALHNFLSAKPIGVVLFEMPFVLSFVSNWVTGSRIPDVMYYTAQRLDAYKAANPDWKRKPYILVPDLVIEVVSPHDDLGELDEKIDQYLRDGVQEVWAVDPERTKVSLYHLIDLQPFTKQQTVLKVGDLLTAGDIIPGFAMEVASLFE